MLRQAARRPSRHCLPSPWERRGPSGLLPPYVLPAPAKVGEAALRFFGSARQLGHLEATLVHVAASIALAFTLGALLALSAHYATWTGPAIHHRLSPFLNAFSGIGWTLLAVLWFGVSTTTVVFSISVVL